MNKFRETVGKVGKLGKNRKTMEKWGNWGKEGKLCKSGFPIPSRVKQSNSASKHKNTGKIYIKSWIFATCNYF